MKNVLIIFSILLFIQCNVPDKKEHKVPPENPTPTPEIEMTKEEIPSEVIVWVDKLNIRDQPNLKGNVVHQVKEDAILKWDGVYSDNRSTITLRNKEITARWMEIQIPDKTTTGWVFEGTVAFPNDIIRVGKNRPYKSLHDVFKGEKLKNKIIKVDEGRYESDKEIYARGENLLIEGKGIVEIICTNMEANVFWISGTHITIRNIVARHVEPPFYAHCVGNVFTLDVCDYVTLEKCDINGCGRVGVYYNISDTKLNLFENKIHNNSLAAISDQDGNLYNEAVENHPLITFRGNYFVDNGASRALRFEKDGPDDVVERFGNWYARLLFDFNLEDEMFDEVQINAKTWERLFKDTGVLSPNMRNTLAQEIKDCGTSVCYHFFHKTEDLFKAIRIKSKEITGDQAIVNAYYVDEEEKELEQIQFKVIKGKNQWYIDDRSW